MERWEDEPKTIRVDHPNGYHGVLYGRKSMSIYYNGDEIFHTGFRKINTKEELYKQLEEMPELMKKLREYIHGHISE